MTPEQKASVSIDALLVQAGWHVCGVSDANIHAAVGVAIREFPLNNGFGFADYLLYVNGKACGVIEAKKEGATLSGVEVQSGRYAQGVSPLAAQIRIVAEVERPLFIVHEVEAEVDTNLKRAQALRQATLAKAFSSGEKNK